MGTCKLEYSQGNLHIPVIHNTYNTQVQDSTKTREIQPTDIFLLHDDFIIVQLLQNNKYAFSCYPPNSLYLNNAKYECSHTHKHTTTQTHNHTNTQTQKHTNTQTHKHTN